MIDVRYSQNAAAWWEYYLAHRALSDRERKGVWFGRACAELGWNAGDVVTGEQFACMLDGYTINRTSCVPCRQPSRRCGYDLIVSAPKSLSIAALCWDDSDGRERIQQAFLASTLKLGSVCEMLVKRQGPAPVRQISGNMAAAVFTHHMSRYGDPHLHSHIVIGNLTRIGERWAAIALDVIFKAKRALDRLFMADLSERLRRSGIRAKLQEGHCELPIAAALCRKFSKGHERLETAANKLGVEGNRRSALMAVLNDRLRPKKRPAKSPFPEILSPSEQQILRGLRRRPGLARQSRDPREVVRMLRNAVLNEGAPTEPNRLKAAAAVAAANQDLPVDNLVRMVLERGLLHGIGGVGGLGSSRLLLSRISEEEIEVEAANRRVLAAQGV